MTEDKRYVVTIEAYVYAKNDYMARKRSHDINDKVNMKFPNAQSTITELGEQPFASLSYRKLDDKSSPMKKNKPLPF